MGAAVIQRMSESNGAIPNDLDQCRALLGRRLAERFEVGSILGYGGSSLIFEGWHLVLRHPVAVKVLRAEYAVEPALVNHFAQEAMVTAQMRSPHVVRVFDTGLIDDTVPYTVLELLRGQTLSELRRNGRRFTPEEAIDLVLQACRALDESHSRGIIHRDIKPDNLFLAELPDGTNVLKVIDFGVAKHGASHTFLTEAWVGTPGYMAPEQISNPSAVDERADIWALGVVLFELLTGRSPFRGTTSEEVLASTLRDEALPLEVAHQGLPLELYNAVASCLAKSPAQRFRRVQELASVLVRARTRFAQGADISTGIVRLPDNWDLRVTPPHGWALPGPTVALKPPVNKVVLRRRMSLALGLAAGVVCGVALANYPLNVFREPRADVANPSSVPVDRTLAARETDVPSLAQNQSLQSSRPVEALQELAHNELAHDASPAPARAVLAAPQTNTATTPQTPVQPRALVAPAVARPNGARPISVNPAVNTMMMVNTAAKVNPTSEVGTTSVPNGTKTTVGNEREDSFGELLTPWTKPKK